MKKNRNCSHLVIPRLDRGIHNALRALTRKTRLDSGFRHNDGRIVTKHLTKLIIIVIAALGLSACHNKEAKNTIKVGTIAGPETQLMQVAKKVALKRFDLHVKIVAFSDYNMPNAALSDGSIEANMFQNVPYLKAQVKAHHYKFAVVGRTFIYPMGLYSKKIKKLSQLKDAALVAIPNDPSNEARGLLLLQKAHLIRLKKSAGINATPIDIVANPKHLKFVELGAAQLPRALADVALAAINTNYAIPAGLSPSRDALFKEGADSIYADVVVVRVQDKNKPKVKQLVAALHSKAVLRAAKQLFKGDAIVAWKTHSTSKVSS